MSKSNSGALNIQNSCESGSADPDSTVKIKKEWSKPPQQKYVGEILHGNLHGPGFYVISSGEKLFYDGLFYANKLEGYAQVFYNDGSDFQGLFKDNARFGPGVFTYPNGEQDVGLWIGQNLVRLASLNPDNLIPRLATTSVGQFKLLKYRYLVPVSPKPTNTAYDILVSLGASKDILRRADELYNVEADNKHNVFFKRKVYNEQFYEGQDFSIDVALTQEELESLEDEWLVDDENLKTPVDLNEKRMTQIPEQLEDVEDKLKAAQERRATLQQKVDQCRACCYHDMQVEESSCPREASQGSADESLRPSIGFEPFFIPKRKSPVIEPKILERRISESTTDICTDSLFFATEDTMSSMHSFTSVQKTPESDTTDGDVVSQIKNYLMENGCDETMYVEDLNDLEEKLEGAVKDELFFASIKRNLQEKLEKHVDRSQMMSWVKTKKVLVTELLAWNNDKDCMRMLRHSFLHRKSEYMVNFEVSDLVAGNRTYFKVPGPREKHCINFLKACSDGNLQAIHEHLNKHGVDVNVCDAKGNNGVFFAAKNNHREVIKVLTNLGTNLNQENDEGLMPLSLCILIVVAFKNKVEVWEKSFLPPTEPTTDQTDSVKWYPNMSLLDMSRRSIQSQMSENVANGQSTYLFDTSFVTAPEQKVGTPKDKLMQRMISVIPSFEIDIRVVEDTVDTLLDCGANPNNGSSPLPPLFLSLFTQEPSLVESLLDSSVDINAKIHDDLTVLHVIASSKCTQPNIRICRLLISYNCDSRQKTSLEHWKERKLQLLGKDVDSDTVEDLGKNPLHLLCVRRDFALDQSSYFYDMVVNFRDSYIDFSDTYLGHTALSLAALVGNKKIVEALMTYRLVDPHQVLGGGMGNVLTIYTLKRYEEMIPPNAEEILRYLSDEGVNVLYPIGDFENSIAFMLKEHEAAIAKKRTDASKKNKGVSQEAIMDYLIALGRETIIKCIQLMAVENLYNMIEDGCVEHSCVPILCEYLTPTLAISNLRFIFNHGKIEPDRFDRSMCAQLVNVVKDNLNAAIEREALLKRKSKSEARSIPNTSDYTFMLNMVDFSNITNDELKFQLLPPGLDNPSKYKVCFHCLRGRDRELVVCPRCQLIHFCSASCNKENLRLKLHPCNTNFYASEQSRVKSPQALQEAETLVKLFGRISDHCDKRRMEKIKSERQMERERLERQMKLDTYGTKFMRKNSQAGSSSKCPSAGTLAGSMRDPSEIEIRLHLAAEFTRQSAPEETPTKEPVAQRPPPKKRIDPLDRIRSNQTPCKNEEDKCRRQECARCKKIKCKCLPGRRKSKPKIAVGKEMEDTNVTLRKLRLVPDRCRQFVKLLKGYFPDLKFSSLLLPYACYSNGHLYYKFLDNKFNRTYSMM